MTIRREEALKLRELVNKYCFDSYTVGYDYDSTIADIYNCGFRTVMFPYKTHRNANKFQYCWAMVDEAQVSKIPSDDEHPSFELFTFEIDKQGSANINDHEVTTPIYFYESIQPLNEYMHCLTSIYIKKPQFITWLGGLSNLLAKPTRYSNSLGRGYRDTDEHKYWNEAFDAIWTEGNNLSIEPTLKIKRNRMLVNDRLLVGPKPAQEELTFGRLVAA